MGKIFCVEFQRIPLKFHTKYLTHTLKDMIFIQHGEFLNLRVHMHFWNAPLVPSRCHPSPCPPAMYLSQPRSGTCFIIMTLPSQHRNSCWVDKIFFFIWHCNWNEKVILMKFLSMAALKVVTDNLRCNQWWKFHQNDDIFVSVFILKWVPCHQRWTSAMSVLTCHSQKPCQPGSVGIISCMHPANERWCYTVTSSLIGWVHTYNDPWIRSTDGRWQPPNMAMYKEIWPKFHEISLFQCIHFNWYIYKIIWWLWKSLLRIDSRWISSVIIMVPWYWNGLL